MPMPPILPVIDWKSVYDSGTDFAAWLAAAANPAHAEAMASAVREQTLEAPVQNLLKGTGRTVHVVAIAEDWCGDVVRHVPVLERIAQASPRVQVRYISRAQHKDVFARFLTNGGEAIPKFIFLSEAFVECGNWGPMTEACRRVIARGKACGDGAAARQKVSQMYASDADKAEVARELVALFALASSETP